MTLQNQDVLRLTRVDVRPAETWPFCYSGGSHPDAATPTYENRKTKRIRLVDKSEDEVLALSCHLFVYLPPIRHEPLTYRAILEEVPGFGRTYVQGLIGEI